MPRLKAVRDSLEDLDEKYHDLYEKQDDGTYVLADLDDKPFKSKLDEFRTNNRQLHNEKERYKTEYEKLQEKMARFEEVGDDFNPEVYKQGLEAIREREKNHDRDLMDEGKIEELIAKRTEAMRTDYESKISAKGTAYEEVTRERNALRGELESLTIDQTIESAVGAVGQLRKGALEDVKGRARKVWKINDIGKMRPEAEGEPLFGKDGSELTPREWAENLLENAPHLFEPGSGGGAGGGTADVDYTPTKTIDGADPLAVGRNLESLAKGKMKVR